MSKKDNSNKQINNTEKVNTNINSKFNYTVELGVKATKHAMKVKKSVKDKVVHILMLAFIVLMIGVLAWDVVREASIVIDLIILIALIIAEIFNIIMPFIILRMQKKFLRQVVVNEFDYTLTEIIKDRCVESYYKNNKVVMQNSCAMVDLYGYMVEGNHIFLVFNNFATAIFDLSTLQNATQEGLIQHLESTISKNRIIRTSKRGRK